MQTGESILYISRVVEFSAAHRLYREDLSLGQNLDLFGPCANANGHGHNYTLEATFKGTVVKDTGMVVHFSSLRRLLDELVVLPMDHKNLNLDVPFLKGVLPSSENVVVRLWSEISRAIPGQGWSLHKLKLTASPRNWVEYFGPDHHG
jgi:6-pyruvoyltetrahydropterin/6-carboxytetrahydropterin synthase